MNLQNLAIMHVSDKVDVASAPMASDLVAKASRSLMLASILRLLNLLRTLPGYRLWCVGTI